MPKALHLSPLENDAIRLANVMARIEALARNRVENPKALLTAIRDLAEGALR